MVRYGQLAPTLDELRRKHKIIIVQPLLAATCDFEGKHSTPRHLLRTIAQREELKKSVAGFPTLAMTEASLRILPLIPRGPSIQSGDALWIAGAAADESLTVYTGDKKALVELARTAACSAIVKSLQGRCVILPDLILSLAERNGIHGIRKGIVADPDCDAGINEFFPKGLTTPQTLVLEALRAYVGHCAQQTGGITRRP